MRVRPGPQPGNRRLRIRSLLMLTESQRQNDEVESSHSRPRDVVLLGSTGSIGTQAADVIRRNPGRFKIAGLAAGGGNPGLLASQAIEFGAEVVAVEREQAAAAVSEALRAQGAGPHPKVLAGPDGV